MARIPPGSYYSPNQSSQGPYQHHVPNPKHYDDLSVSNQQKNLLVGFEKHAVKESDMDSRAVGGYPNSNYNNNNNNTPRLQTPRKDQPGGDPRNKAVAGPPADYENLTEKKGFFALDPVTFIVLIAYGLAVAAFVMELWCYIKDSNWNAAVLGNTPLPKIPDEQLFSGKMLHFNSRDDTLLTARNHFVRESRVWEFIHIIFCGCFLIATLFECASYVTRGRSDYTKLVIIFYMIFGGVGMIIAFFPLLNLQIQQNDYKISAQALSHFAQKIFNAPASQWGDGFNNATAHDALLLKEIVQYCSVISGSGFSVTKETRTILIFNRNYKYWELQTLGFCVRHNTKIIVTILTFIFALLCCIVPCVYCMEERTDTKVGTEVVRTGGQGSRAETPKLSSTGRQAPPPKLLPQPHTMTDTPATGFRTKEPHYTMTDGTQMSEKELELIHKWKDFISRDSD